MFRIVMQPITGYARLVREELNIGSLPDGTKVLFRPRAYHANLQLGTLVNGSNILYVLGFGDGRRGYALDTIEEFYVIEHS